MLNPRPLSLACVVILALATAAWSQQVTFKVKHQLQHPNYPRVWWLVQNGATLAIDDAAKTLSVDTKPKPLAVTFDMIDRVIFERTTHMRGGGWGGLLGTVGLGPIGSRIDGKAVNDYWAYIQYRGANGLEGYVLEIPKDLSQPVMDKMKASLGAKVTVATFDEPMEAIKADTLKDMKSRQDYSKADAKTHPLPELKADKALIVIACPLIDDPVREGPTVRLHANDRVVSVNSWGSYGWAYLDPGEYVLAAQLKDKATTVRIKVEAGKDYYFLEDIIDDGVLLSRHTKELVMHQVSGSRYGEWKPK